MENNYNNQENLVLFLGIVIMIYFIIFAFGINIISPFLKEIKYIKMEMKRSYDDDEYYYWKRELKMYLLRSIPIIGKFFK